MSCHRWRAPFVGLGLCFAATSGEAQDAATTRIEPRPVYGATITVERGVRVFRPLPAVRNVIINPGLAAPVYLGFAACSGDTHGDRLLPRGCR